MDTRKKRQFAKLITRMKTCFDLKYVKTNVKAGPQQAKPQNAVYWNSKYK